MLDGRVALDTDLVAKRLTGGGAVDVSDQSRFGVLELSHQLLPISFHRLAAGLALNTAQRSENSVQCSDVQTLFRI